MSYRIVIDFEAAGHVQAKEIAGVLKADAEVTIKAFPLAGDVEVQLKAYSDVQGKWGALKIRPAGTDKIDLQ